MVDMSLIQDRFSVGFKTLEASVAVICFAQGVPGASYLFILLNCWE